MLPEDVPILNLEINCSECGNAVIYVAAGLKIAVLGAATLVEGLNTKYRTEHDFYHLTSVYHAGVGM